MTFFLLNIPYRSSVRRVLPIFLFPLCGKSLRDESKWMAFSNSAYRNTCKSPITILRKIKKFFCRPV